VGNATRLASQQRLMLLLANEIDAVVAELDKRLKNHVGYRNLLQIKGIGPTLAAVFVVEIGDINRFPTAQALTCWAGLTPRHYESDRTVRRGQISKEGCALVRWPPSKRSSVPANRLSLRSRNASWSAAADRPATSPRSPPAGGCSRSATTSYATAMPAASRSSQRTPPPPDTLESSCGPSSGMTTLTGPVE
jgi:hypothetical protein